MNCRTTKLSGLRYVLFAIAAAPALAAAQAAESNVYFGNLHSHTSYSDGSGTPEQAYRHARDVARLDFLAITEHNHAQAEDGASEDRKDGLLVGVDHSLYEGPQSNAVVPTAERFTKDGQFVAHAHAGDRQQPIPGGQPQGARGSGDAEHHA